MGRFITAYLIWITSIGLGVAEAATPPVMSVAGQFNVSSTGATTYTVPIAVPPGTAGMMPSLSLSYSSQNGDGIVGLGWALGGLPTITRCPRTIAQDSGVHGSVNYDSNDRFCMGDQRLMLKSGTYGADGSEYRTEIESFSKIIAHGDSGTGTRTGPAWFEVWTKAGQHMEFGHTTDSQVLVVSTGTSTIPTGTVREWAASKISDAVSNYLTVTYNCTEVSGACTDTDRTANGEVYPLRVDYTGNANAGVAPYNSVRFTYASRADTMPLYQAGGVVKPTVVLTHITTYQGASTSVFDYGLSYRTGTSTLRSHLISVTQCDNASHCLPVTTFGWQGTTSTAVSNVSSTPTLNRQVVPADFNGDGLTDEALLFGCSAASYPVYLGQSTFGFASSSYTLPMPSGVTSWPSCFGPDIRGTTLAPDGTSDILVGVLSYKTSGPPPLAQFYMAMVTSGGAINLANYTSATLASANAVSGDFNGDGIVDFFFVESPTSYAYLGNTSGGFSPDSGIGGLNPSLTAIQAADFDGDGCTDLLQSTSGTSSVIYAYNCNPVVATSVPPTVSGTSQMVTGDFNGDGKTDELIFDPSAAGALWLSTGTGFKQETGATIPAGWNVKAVGDWNGDGKADLLVETSPGSDYALYLSTGTDFTPALDSMGNPVVLSGSAGAGAVVADWDNNGNSDLLIQTPSSGDAFDLIDFVPELMTSVSNGLGATTNISYDRINQNGSFYTKGTSAAYPTQDMDGPQYVVKEVDASNGLGTCMPPSTSNCYQTTYSYAGAQKNLQGRGFSGFSQVGITDPQTGIVQTTNYSTAFPYVGLVTSQARVHGAVTLSSTTNTYTNNSSCGVTPAASGIYIDCLAQSVSVSNDLNGAAFPTTTTDYTYDNYGNALTVNVSVAGGSSKNTTNTYSNDTTNWFLGRLLTTSVNSVFGPSNMTRQSSFAYDASTGLLTQESIEPGVSTCNNGSSSCTLTTSYTYDAFGHRITSTIYGTGITSRTSYAFYDTNGEFQTAAANALGQYETWTYDARFGLPATHTGPNFLTTAWSYDGFGRPVLETRPDGTKSALSYAYCSGGCPANGQFYVQSEVFASNGTTQIGPVSTGYYDMLSRSIVGDTQGFDSGNTRIATVYDGNGRVQQTSRPYFTAGGTPAWTSFSYDDLGRVTTATFPDTSQATYGFNGLNTTVTNSLSQTTTTTKNAQGLTASVQDAASNATSYVYDAFGDLLTVTDPVGNVIANSFDIRGNKFVSHDPDMGSWSYAYDVLGELTSQTDAKGQTTSLTYDLLGRAITRTEPTLYSSWTYGTSASMHNVGQLAQATACTAPGCATLVSDRTFTFDGVGRQSTSALRTPTDYFAYGTAYNATNGQIASISYPSGLVVNRAYNAYGYLTALTGAHGEPIWQGTARDAELHLTAQVAGNGVATNQSFDPATGLIQHQRAGPGGGVASFDYAFDAIGNLTSRTDNSQPFTERFCYDSLNRLTNYNIGGACTGGKTASYDALGNIITKSDTGTYAYGAAGPHQVSAIAGTVDGLTNPKYSYDMNGNLTCMSSGASCSGTVGRTVNLTSFNMAASLSHGGDNLALTYDDQHQRIRQYAVTGSTATETVYLNDSATGAMSERVTTGSSSATVWNSFNWGAAPWGGTLPGAMPTFVDYITVDGQIVAQHTVQYSSANAWGRHNWGAFNWGPPSGSVWGSTAPANPPRFKWGSDPWSGPVQGWAWFTLDHLGSVAVITDQGGNVTQRLSYDAWGKQRNANGADASCGAITAPTTRGFTNQEQLPNVVACAVNLNARLYDPSIGKFMAADSIVGNPFNGQSFNRYAYVVNNPLSGSDPSGHLCDAASCTFGPEFNGLPGLALPGGQTNFGDQNCCYASSIIPINNNLNRNQVYQFNLSGNNAFAESAIPIQNGFTYSSRYLVGTTEVGDPSKGIGITGWVHTQSTNEWGGGFSAFANSLPSQSSLPSPATKVELRFRSVFGSPWSHGFIVVTDIKTRAQVVSQASPGGPHCPECSLLEGSIYATTEPYGLNSRGFHDHYYVAAEYTTDIAAAAIAGDLRNFSTNFNAMLKPYFVEIQNSNTYAATAWRSLTGSIPSLPSNVDAPGYHALQNGAAGSWSSTGASGN